MLFESLGDSNGVDYIEQFIEVLDDESAQKVVNKLSAFEHVSFAELMRSEHIKKIEGKLFEMRIRIKGDCYRFLGTTRGDTFFMAHAIKKKTDKLKRNDIEIALQRVRNLP